MNNHLQEYIGGLPGEAADIPEGRKEILSELAASIEEHRQPGEAVPLTFICTHNSRRSHLCQIWCAVLAEHGGVEGIETYSGGTEVTAFNPRAVAAIKRAGFTVEKPEGENPRYKVYYDEQKDPLICYSKTFDDPANPSVDFGAVMTCSEADQNCPVVPGAAFRVTLPYEDPKQADDTRQEAQVYDERCRQIAAEMYYLISELI